MKEHQILVESTNNHLVYCITVGLLLSKIYSTYKLLFLIHSWEPCQAKHAAWPLLTQKLKFNSTKTGQDDETESRKTSKKEYISNWFQRKKLHSNFGRLAKEKTHKLKPTLEILHAFRVSGNVGWQTQSEPWTSHMTWDPHTLESILPAACEKNVFCLFCPSAGGKLHVGMFNLDLRETRLVKDLW